MKVGNRVDLQCFETYAIKATRIIGAIINHSQFDYLSSVATPTLPLFTHRLEYVVPFVFRLSAYQAPLAADYSSRLRIEA